MKCKNSFKSPLARAPCCGDSPSNNLCLHLEFVLSLQSHAIVGIYVLCKYFCAKYSSMEGGEHSKCWDTCFECRQLLMLRIITTGDVERANRSLKYLHLAIVVQCWKVNLHFLEHPFDFDTNRRYGLFNAFWVAVRFLHWYVISRNSLLLYPESP